MASLKLMVHLHMKHLGLPKIQGGYRCIKSKHGHFHIEQPKSENELAVTISNQKELHINGEEKKSLLSLISNDQMKTLILGGSQFQNKIKKEYNLLRNNLLKFYKEFLWLQNHINDTFSPSYCFLYALDGDEYWSTATTSSTHFYYLKIGKEDDLETTLNNLQFRDVPEYFEMLVEAENLQHVSPISSLVLSITALEVLLKYYISNKYKYSSSDFTNLKSIIDLVYPILNEHNVIKFKEQDINILKDLIGKRNQIIHGGIAPHEVEKNASSALSITKEIMNLIDADLHPFKQNSISPKMRELNAACEIMNQIGKPKYKLKE